MPDMLEVGKNERWQSEHQPFLGSLSVAMPAAPPEILAAWLGWPESHVENLRTDLTQIIEEDAAGYRLYHRSMADFLATRVYQEDSTSIRNRYYTPPHEQHERIVHYYRGQAPSWYDVDWRQVDNYRLLHLANHLAGTGELGTLRDLAQFSAVCRSVKTS